MGGQLTQSTMVFMSLVAGILTFNDELARIAAIGANAVRIQQIMGRRRQQNAPTLTTVTVLKSW